MMAAYLKMSGDCRETISLLVDKLSNLTTLSAPQVQSLVASAIILYTLIIMTLTLHGVSYLGVQSIPGLNITAFTASVCAV